jgi:hypothetical protein
MKLVGDSDELPSFCECFPQQNEAFRVQDVSGQSVA